MTGLTRQPVDPTRITVFTDASFQPQTGAAAWGAWAKREGWAEGYRFGGYFMQQMPSSNAAEICGLANAVHLLGRDGKLDGINKVMLQSDSLHALQLIWAFIPHVSLAAVKNAPIGVLKEPAKERAASKQPYMTAINVLTQVMETHNFAFELRHIHGHRRGSGRTWVNRQCDLIASDCLVQSPFYLQPSAKRPKRKR